MGCDERPCEYCKCIATEYSIIECEICNKCVCINNERCTCDYFKSTIPKFDFTDVATCGFCQLKSKLSIETRLNFEDTEKNLLKKINKLNKELIEHYKKLEMYKQ